MSIIDRFHVLVPHEAIGFSPETDSLFIKGINFSNKVSKKYSRLVTNGIVIIVLGGSLGKWNKDDGEEIYQRIFFDDWV